MSEDMLYVHYETVSNYVLSKGIAVKDYTKLARSFQKTCCWWTEEKVLEHMIIIPVFR